LALAFAGLVALYSVAPPFSTLMLARLVEARPYERKDVPLRAIAPVLVASVIASEDATFCANSGVDWGALREVMGRRNGPARGASTITMQVAKNLFLWPGRSFVRKGIEIPMALVLGQVWPRARTVEIYLNIAEWGDGLFGAEAAAERYFHKKASDLDAREAALLATALPNPTARNAAHPTQLQRRLAAHVMAKAEDEASYMRCLQR